MATNGNAIGTPFLKSNTIPPAIRNSMILWYDLKKQGATNETMSTNPILKDLSGNGHDATCYNFAWSGMSGIGGYSIDYSNHRSTANRCTYIYQNGEFNITRINDTAASSTNIIDISASLSFPSASYEITGITGTGIRLGIGTWQSGSEQHYYFIEEDGTYTIPQQEYEVESVYGFNVNVTDVDCNIIIKPLPLYPNALVSDGVDDYCLVEGLPLLNKEDGYTVIAKRKHIQKSSVNSPLLSKATGTDTSGAFQFERNIINTSYFTGSFGQQTQITEFSQSDDVYQTSTSYNGSIVLNPGNGEDNNFMVIFSRDKVLSLACALYSLLLFNRDLSIEEIEWVKTN